MSHHPPSIESVAKALIINELRQVLVLTVGEYEKHPEKSFKPDLPGGLVDPGETERDAVIREIHEEAGITVAAADTHLAYTETKFYADENKSVSKSLYIVALYQTPEVMISWEHSAYEWINLDELLQTKTFRPFYAKAIAYSLEHGLIKTK